MDGEAIAWSPASGLARFTMGRPQRIGTDGARRALLGSLLLGWLGELFRTLLLGRVHCSAQRGRREREGKCVYVLKNKTMPARAKGTRYVYTING